MNPTVPLDLGDFFSCKRYGHLIGWSTPFDLGHDGLDLGYDGLDLGYNVVDLDYDVVDLDYDVLNKNKRIRGRKSKQISR
jgi:hypothetical protein